MLTKNIYAFLKVLLVISLLRSRVLKACNLKTYENYLLGYENATYLGMKENDKIIYRGISTLRKDALEIAFKDIKNKKCPTLPTKI